MTRAIKFRVWDVRKKRMRSWEDMVVEELVGIGIWLDTPEWYLPMQWTGLTDKNSKEIYEGDIVTWRGEDAVGWHNYKTVVKWNEEDVYFDVPLQRRWIQDREVIGNIYEHPQLLETQRRA